MTWRELLLTDCAPTSRQMLKKLLAAADGPGRRARLGSDRPRESGKTPEWPDRCIYGGVPTGSRRALVHRMAAGFSRRVRSLSRPDGGYVVASSFGYAFVSASVTSFERVIWRASANRVQAPAFDQGVGPTNV